MKGEERENRQTRREEKVTKSKEEIMIRKDNEDENIEGPARI